MAAQPGEDVVAVLPDRLGDDERRVAVDRLRRPTMPIRWLEMKP